jgi:hypothetical protein
MGEIKARGAAIVQGARRLEILIKGDTTLNIPSPLAEIKAQVAGFVSVDAFADIDVPPARLPCVLPAFEEAGKALVAVGTELAGTVEAQATFVAYITTGA